MVKHFVVNNFETGRTGSGWPPADRGPAVDIRVSRRALEEIYFPPFRRALRRRRRVRHGFLQPGQRLLRLPESGIARHAERPVGMGGIRRSRLRCSRCAIRWRPPGRALTSRGWTTAEGRLPDDFTSGRIGPDRLDDIVTRIVSTMVTHGLLDQQAAVPGPPAAESLELAAEAAVAGSVLLVNRAGALPARGRRQIPRRHRPGGAGRHLRDGRIRAVKLHPHRVVTPLAGIRQRAGTGVPVEHAQGSWGDVPLPAIPPALLSLPRAEPAHPAGPGVLADYADGPGPGQTPGQRVTRIEPGIHVSRAARRPGTAMAGLLDDRADP